MPYKNEHDFELFMKVVDFAHDFFEDMLMESEEYQGNYVDFDSCIRGLDWYNYAVDIPGDDRSTNHLRGDAVGEFNTDTLTLTVRHDFIDDDRVILHEMIHMLEYGLDNSGIKVLHEMVLFSLYDKLSKKIQNLPDMCARLLVPDVQEYVNTVGGEHGLLFFLKSLDIDLKKGWPLYTTFGDYYSQFIEVDQRPVRPSK